MAVMAERDHDGIVEMAISLCLFYPYGVGFAMTYAEAMELDIDVAERMVEAKNKMIEPLTKKR